MAAEYETWKERPLRRRYIYLFACGRGSTPRWDGFWTISRPASWRWPRRAPSKTTFALVALRMLLAEHVRRVIVVTPTTHLKSQWAQAAVRLQLHLDPAWSSSAELNRLVGAATDNQLVGRKTATLSAQGSG